MTIILNLPKWLISIRISQVYFPFILNSRSKDGRDTNVIMYNIGPFKFSPNKLLLSSNVSLSSDVQNGSVDNKIQQVNEQKQLSII